MRLDTLLLTPSPIADLNFQRETKNNLKYDEYNFNVTVTFYQKLLTGSQKLQISGGSRISHREVLRYEA